jgi:hypothetical protein
MERETLIIFDDYFANHLKIWRKWQYIFMQKKPCSPALGSGAERGSRSTSATLLADQPVPSHASIEQHRGIVRRSVPSVGADCHLSPRRCAASSYSGELSWDYSGKIPAPTGPARAGDRQPIVSHTSTAAALASACRELETSLAKA